MALSAAATAGLIFICVMITIFLIAVVYLYWWTTKNDTSERKTYSGARRMKGKDLVTILDLSLSSSTVGGSEENMKNLNDSGFEEHKALIENEPHMWELENESKKPQTHRPLIARQSSGLRHANALRFSTKQKALKVELDKLANRLSEINSRTPVRHDVDCRWRIDEVTSCHTTAATLRLRLNGLMQKGSDMENEMLKKRLDGLENDIQETIATLHQSKQRLQNEDTEVQIENQQNKDSIQCQFGYIEKYKMENEKRENFQGVKHGTLEIENETVGYPLGPGSIPDPASQLQSAKIDQDPSPIRSNNLANNPSRYQAKLIFMQNSSSKSEEKDIWNTENLKPKDITVQNSPSLNLDKIISHDPLNFHHKEVVQSLMNVQLNDEAVQSTQPHFTENIRHDIRRFNPEVQAIQGSQSVQPVDDVAHDDQNAEPVIEIKPDLQRVETVKEVALGIQNVEPVPDHQNVKLEGEDTFGHQNGAPAVVNAPDPQSGEPVKEVVEPLIEDVQGSQNVKVEEVSQHLLSSQYFEEVAPNSQCLQNAKEPTRGVSELQADPIAPQRNSMMHKETSQDNLEMSPSIAKNSEEAAHFQTTENEESHLDSFPNDEPEDVDICTLL